MDKKPETLVKHCKHCGKEFIVYRRKSDGKFSEKEVCDECLKPAKTKTLICKKCGKPFTLGRYANGNLASSRQFCDECLVAPKTKNIVCMVCGKEFTITRREDGTFRHVKRCPDCQDGKPTRMNTCKICGKQFEVGRTPGGVFSNRKVCDACTRPETTTCICKKCGKAFQVGRSDKGTKGFLYRVLCPDCDDFGREEFPRVCQYCGKAFYVKRYGKSGKFPNYIYCEDCIGKPVKKICKKCGKEFDSVITSQYRYAYRGSLCDECHKQTGEASEPENEFYALLLEAGILDSDILKEKVLYYNGANNFYRYDFAVRGTNLLFEINPTHTHNSEATSYDVVKGPKYHLHKSQIAEENGYFCVHVWQWDDYAKIIATFLRCDNILYARKLELVTNLNKQEADLFLNLNHLQGDCYGNSVNLGLKDKKTGELIQVMTFGKPRYNSNYQWELLRLCTKQGCRVVGGTERLFSCFLKLNSPQSIISYCDMSKFSGEVYERLGFKLLRRNQPQKVWSPDRYEDKSYITDSLLRQKGYDKLFNANYGKGTDNEQLMIEHGWLPVYDCGQKTFVYTLKENKEEKGQIVICGSMPIEI